MVKRSYGLALITELRRHGYELSPGKLYPVLHELEATGYLARLDRVVNGKVELVGELLQADVARRRPRGKR